MLDKMTNQLNFHGNALVLRAALRGLEKYDDPQEGEGWGLRLQGVRLSLQANFAEGPTP